MKKAFVEQVTPPGARPWQQALSDAPRPVCDPAPSIATLTARQTQFRFELLNRTRLDIR